MVSRPHLTSPRLGHSGFRPGCALRTGLRSRWKSSRRRNTLGQHRDLGSTALNKHTGRVVPGARTAPCLMLAQPKPPTLCSLIIWIAFRRLVL
ncbi:hypothetical protein RRG08_043524 [Elysia crispata]|uniref:Uncharacterized protein n=1 Tax=Elysia crispata TaxID=231223 RepID=A0AAE1CXP9_9GAST|nr:hypothetical protein RRG08_043524 [Elysia crispata]